jgi:Alg9-like mannosyltransferase family
LLCIFGQCLLIITVTQFTESCFLTFCRFLEIICYSPHFRRYSLPTSSYQRPLLDYSDSLPYIQHKKTCLSIFCLFTYQSINIVCHLACPFLALTFICTAFRFVLLLAQIGIDFLYYGDLIFTPYTFLDFNILRNVSAFYGANSAFWYIYAGMPFLLTGWLPFFLLGIFLSYGRTFFRTFIVAALCCHSCMVHKEFRFIYPLLPAAFVYVGHGISLFIGKATKLDRRKKYAILSFCAVISISIGYFISSWHCVGPTNVVRFLHSRLTNLSLEQRNALSVFWLTPCHAGPYYAGIQFPIKMDFLHCEPPLSDLQPVFFKHRYVQKCQHQEYIREDICFFQNLPINLPLLLASEASPNVLIMFSDTSTAIESLLRVHDFNLFYKTFNCFWYPEGSRHHMLIYKKSSTYL